MLKLSAESNDFSVDSVLIGSMYISLSVKWIHRTTMISTMMVNALAGLNRASMISNFNIEWTSVGGGVSSVLITN